MKEEQKRTERREVLDEEMKVDGPKVLFGFGFWTGY